MNKKIFTSLTVLAILCTVAPLGPNNLYAHCDGMDGPVVTAAKQALETGDVNLVLIWVSQKGQGAKNCQNSQRGKNILFHVSSSSLIILLTICVTKSLTLRNPPSFPPCVRGKERAGQIILFRLGEEL